MVGKRGAIINHNLINYKLIFVLLIFCVFVSASVSAADQQSCNNQGGIYCPLINYCAMPNPTNIVYDKVCVINSDQNVILSQRIEYSYHFKEFKVLSGIVRFMSKTSETPCGGAPCAAGTGAGSGAIGGIACGGQNGANGGHGGFWGFKGDNGFKAPEPGGSGSSAAPGLGGEAGGLVNIYSSDIIDIKGGLSVVGSSGTSGNYPGSADDDCDNLGGAGDAGCGGSGGGGGGGAGILRLFSKKIEILSGKIYATGGIGGNGGKGGNDDEGSSSEDGGAGGPGGGGKGGLVVLNAQKINHDPANILVAGGSPGSPDYGQCKNAPNPPAKAGEQGSLVINDVKENDPDGNPSTLPTQGNGFFCNDYIDNDKDFLFDMDDPDCYDITNEYSQARISIPPWDTGVNNAIYDLFRANPFLKYNASALNGSDGVCGDDPLMFCQPKYENCSVIPLSDCGSYSQFGCSAFQSGSSCSGTISCSAFSSFNDGACTPAAPSGCTSSIISNSGCGEYGTDYCFNCIGDDISCSGFTNQNSCLNTYPDFCTWTNSVNSCIGNFNINCGDFSNKQTCEQNAPLCSYSYSKTPGQKDLGYISNNGEYACFDNKQGTSLSINTPGNNYVWRDFSNIMFSTGNSLYPILRANKTEFIFNGEKWSYCDASGTGIYGPQKIPELGTFNSEFSGGNKRCSNELYAILNAASSASSIKVYDCKNNTRQECLDNYALSNPTSLLAFCFNDANPSVKANYNPAIRFNTGAQGGFDDVCFNSCHVRRTSQGVQEFVKLGGGSGSYLGGIPNFDVCSVIGNTIPGCSGSTPVPPNPSCEGIGAFSEECELLGEINTQNSCETIITGLGWDYIPEDRLCNRPGITQFCSGGLMIDSGDSDNQCCFGENAQCATFTNDMCDPQIIPNAEPKDPSRTGICIGQPIGDECCIGEWNYGFETYAGISENESFVCYQQGENNLIQECCDETIGKCFNKNNPLNNYGINNPYVNPGDARQRTYSFSGVPLHVLVYVDSLDKRGSMLLNPQKTFNLGTDFFLSDWSDFDYLEFNVRSTGESPLEINISDSLGNVARLNFWDYSKTGRAKTLTNRIAIPISQLSVTGIDVSKIKSFKIGFATYITNPTVYIDNIFLSSKDSNLNSDTLYCSGPWKKWVSNLDGPIDEGFTNIQNPDDKEIKPYEYACNGQLAFKWSGNACCGDDTRVILSGTDLAEYFIDDSGLCWKGTLVEQDNTLAMATGISDEISRSILFYNGKVQLCDKEISEFNSYKESYTGLSGTSSLLESSNANKVDLFSVRGSWICQSDGWVKQEATNRVRILATELRNLAENNPYTLFCGDYKSVANYYDAIPAPMSGITGSMCVLKKGANSADGKLKEEVIIGLLVANKLTPFEAYEPVLKKFPHLSNESLNINIDCSGAPDDPAESKMYTGCSIDNNQYEVKIYYNKPFNIILIGSKNIVGDGIDNTGFSGFFVDAWDDLKNFISGLFGSTLDYKINIDFDKNTKLQDFYLFEQEDTEVIGVMSKSGTGTQMRTYVRVEYHNLHNSVKILADSIRAKVDSKNTTVTYIPENFKQTIYINSTKGEVVDWKLISSILRVKDLPGQPTNFGNLISNPDNNAVTAD